MKIWYPFTIHEGHLPIKIRRAEKEFLYDEEGNEYIDAISSWWTCIYGHRHPDIMKAMIQQMETLDHIMLAGLTHEPAVELAEKLSNFTGNNFSKVFYSDNGSTAVEVAIKIALQYFSNRKEFNKNQIIHFSDAYHGDTIGAMSVAGKSPFNKNFNSVMFDSYEQNSPDCSDCPFGSLTEQCNVECMESLDFYLAKNSINVAAIIIEPMIMGAGGMKFYKKEVVTLLRKICDRYNVLMIHDEVFTGFGRTGERFAYEQANIVPDIIALAKGLTGGSFPMGATLVTEKIFAEFNSDDPEKVFYHGHTMTGNPIGCSAAIASINLFERENYLEKVRSLSEQMKKHLIEISEEFTEIIRNIRTLGAVSVIELKSKNPGYLDQIAKLIRTESMNNGVILRPLGNQLYIAPPYNISPESIDKIFETIRICLNKLEFHGIQ